MHPLRPRVAAENREDNQIFGAEGDGKALDAILKWIPVEVIAAYQFTIGVVPTVWAGFQVILAVIFTLLTAGWIAFATADPTARHPIAWRQLVLSTFAFAVWVLGTRAAMLSQLNPAWEPWMSSMVLGVGWLLLPVLNGALIRARVPQD